MCFFGSFFLLFGGLDILQRGCIGESPYVEVERFRSHESRAMGNMRFVGRNISASPWTYLYFCTCDRRTNHDRTKFNSTPFACKMK